MTSHSDLRSHDEFGAPSRHLLGRANPRRRPSRKRILGGAVALAVPAWGSESQHVVVPGPRRPPRHPRPAAHASSSSFAGRAGFGGGSGARSTNAAGGSVGTVTGVSGSKFTLSTPAGGKVTVKETSSTVYDDATSTSTASAVTKGTTALVLGKVDSTTITASEVIVQPAIDLNRRRRR